MLLIRTLKCHLYILKNHFKLKLKKKKIEWTSVLFFIILNVNSDNKKLVLKQAMY